MSRRHGLTEDVPVSHRRQSPMGVVYLSWQPRIARELGRVFWRALADCQGLRKHY